MSEVNRDFSNYVLSQDKVEELAGGLIPEIAEIVGVDINQIPDRPSANAPTEAGLSELVRVLGPKKELQDNIEGVKALLGPDYIKIIAGWIDRSGSMFPLERSLVTDEPLPKEIDTLYTGGGVGGWLARRENVMKRFDPDAVGRIVIAAGNRVMKPTEHQLVATFMKRNNGRAPTEAEFASAWMVGSLVAVGFNNVEVHAVDDGDGNKVLNDLVTQKPEILAGTIVVAANAPNGIQAAGQLRIAARNAQPTFDQDGSQLYVCSDSFPLALRGEKPATHQNPATAAGQLARNALFLYKNQ